MVRGGEWESGLLGSITSSATESLCDLDQHICLLSPSPRGEAGLDPSL